MSESVSTTDRRAQHVSVVGLVLQATFTAVIGSIAYWGESDAASVALVLLLVGLPVWFILFLVFKQIRRVGAESLETAELKRSQESGASEHIFEVEGEALLLEQNRLRWMIKWLLPAVTVCVALLLLVCHFFAFDWSLREVFDKNALSETLSPTINMWVVVVVGFGSFLYARYTIALARIPQWRLVRAGATIMAGNAVACLGLAIALMASGTIEWAEPLLACLLRIVLFVLGVEFSLNFVLDLYRPRTLGEIPRPSFDSRLLGLITDPGGIAKTIADTVNYQFGFEVSKTWFYALLQRWMLPICVVTLVIILGLTSVVIVDAEERAVTERFGRLVQPRGESLAPGIHLKWPFPIDVVVRAPVKRIDELVIGEATGKKEDVHQAVIWTEQHDYVPELMLLVASEKETGPVVQVTPGEDASTESESSPVSLLMISVPVEYRVKNIHDFLYNYDDPVKLLENAAYQYVSDYAAGVSIEDLMGPGRGDFNRSLQSLIQLRMDELETGIEIVFAGLRGAHPPAKENVADAFQGVIRAETAKGTIINTAKGRARQILIRVAGTETDAKALDAAIRERDELRRTVSSNSADLIAAESRVDRMLVGDVGGTAVVSGRAAAMIAEARANAIRGVSEAANKSRSFGTEVAAFQAAPELYVRRKALEVYSSLGFIRRYLLVGDPSRYLIEYDPKSEGALDKVLFEGVDKERKN